MDNMLQRFFNLNAPIFRQKMFQQKCENEDDDLVENQSLEKDESM